MAKFHTFKIENSFSQLELLCAQVNEFAQSSDFSDQLLYCLNVCLEEMISNIIKYGYDDSNVHEIEVRLEVTSEMITLTIIDDGHKFNPLEAEKPDINADIKHREVGGIGIFLTCKMANKVTYLRKDDKNILKIFITPHVVMF
jgi:anti-sigma regulatory factor (Ser/Thr protein kinase)